MNVIFVCAFHHHALPPPAATLIIDLACSKCGIIGKSGKLSCCGRGGSWFGNCGSAGEAKLGHKWSEGVEACKAWSQPEIVVGQQLHGAQDDIQLDVSTSTPNAASVDSSIMTLEEIFLSRASTDVLTTDSAHTSASTSIGTQRYGESRSDLLHIIVFVLTVIMYC